MTWTTERIESLKACFAAGLSCGQIAKRMGLSRNAVIGKLNRLGLTRPKHALAKRPDPKSATMRRPVPTKQQMRIGGRRQPAPPTVPLVEEAPIADARRCSLLDLTEVKCRWPIGDPATASFAFCGNDQAPGLPYCAAHARMAYRRAA